jgi:hypothetical protein
MCCKARSKKQTGEEDSTKDSDVKEEEKMHKKTGMMEGNSQIPVAHLPQAMLTHSSLMWIDCF